MGRVERLRAAVVQRHSDAVRALERPLALQVVHLVLLEEELDPSRERVDAGGLVGHHLVEVYFHVVHHDAVVFEVLGRLLVEVRAVQQGLARDAAHVQARAAERAAGPASSDRRVGGAAASRRVDWRAARDSTHAVLSPSWLALIAAT